MLNPLLLIATVLVLLSNPASTEAQPQQDSAKVPAARNPAKASPDSLARAKDIYERDCRICHGTSGNGKTDIAKDRELVLSDWTDPKSLAGRPDQQLFNIIRYGRGKMPAESVGRADNDEVRNLIQYIRAMANGQSTAPSSSPPH